MIIKTKLYFRKFVKKDFKGDNGEVIPKIIVYFLDDNDESFIFSFDDNKENQKYLTMKKDELCELSLTLYKSNKGRYNLWVI